MRYNTNFIFHLPSNINQMNLPNDKVQSSYNKCFLKKTKQSHPKQHFFAEHDVQ